MKVVFVLVLALPLVMLGCSTSEPEIVVQENAFQVSGSPRLIVDTKNGDITVHYSGGEGEIKVTATIRDTDKAEYQTSQIGDTVSVLANASSADAGVDIEVEIPKKAILELESENGGITLGDIDGSVSATTSNGDIVVAGTMEPGSQARLRTSSGDVEVTLVNTPGVWLDAETSSGEISSGLPITITGRSADDRLTGNIGDGSSSLTIRTSSGDITIK